MHISQLPVTVAQHLYHSNFRRREECTTLIQWLDAGTGEKILDVGCGDGFLDARIARSSATVTGIDVDLARLSFARRFNASARTEFHHMDAEQLTFAENTFDRAVSFCVIEHFERDEQVLQEVSRVLKPGGRFVLSADSLSNPEITPAERDRHQKRYAVNTFYTEAILREKLDRAGFELQEARYILSTPCSLALARLSWRLDRLPRRLAAVAAVGHVALGTVGRFASDLSERRGRRRESGLTLLARACSRKSLT